MIHAIRHAATAVAASAVFFLLAPAAHAVDADAAKYLARSNNCFRCHSISHDKDGPSYKKVAKELAGKPDAEAKLIHHITSGEKVKFKDGHTEAHKIVETDPPHDMKQIKNLVDWILSLK